jgi:hypothetical protein
MAFCISCIEAVISSLCVSKKPYFLASAAEAIGKKAVELLESLPEDQRKFRLKSVSPGQWWMI